MKKSLLLLALIGDFALTSFAQVCTPDSTHFTAGVNVYPASLPCITAGTAYTGTVSIRVPDSVDASLFYTGLQPGAYYLYVDSMRIDSVTGMPSGISALTNPADSVWLYGHQYGCMQFSGTTAAAPGSYPLTVYGRSCVHGTVFGFPVDTCVSGSIAPVFSYSLSVCVPPVPVCAPDSSHFTAGVSVYPPSLPCITAGTAYAGTVSIRVPDSVDASVFVSGLQPGTYYLHIDSMRIDSVTGAPSGISVASNPADSVWLHSDQFGCMQFSGTTAAASGSYPLSIYGRSCVHGTVFSFPVDTCASGSLAAFFSYSLGVCGSVVTTVCTPDSSHFTAGVNIYPPSLPCITPGTAYSGTVSIRVPDSVDAHLFVAQLPANTYFLYIDSMRLDSITGMPAGISAASRPGDSVWIHGGGYGCSLFSGTTSASPGNYPLDLYGHGCVHGNIFGTAIDTCISGSLAAYFAYSLTVCGSVNPGTCTPDSSHFTSGVYIYPPTLPCIMDDSAYSQTISIKVPDSIDAHLFVSQLPANTYFLYIDSMRIDSMTGTPSGITAVIHPGDSVWLHGGQYGCALFSGTTTVAPGSFPINVFGSGCVHGNVFGTAIDTCLSGNLSAYFAYTLNVCNSTGGGACTVDASHFSSTVHVYPDTLSCIEPGVPFAGQINIQVPATLDAHDFVAAIPAGTISAYIDSINIMTITGYPAGISSVSNPVVGSWIRPLGTACAAVSGTANLSDTAGTYPLTISGTGCGHFTLAGQTLSQCMQGFSFTTVFPYSLKVCTVPNGISEVSEGTTLSIYPNPNQGSFTVSVFTAERMTGTMSVVDEIGRTVYTKAIDVMGTKQLPLDMGNVSPGAYILVIHAGGKHSVRQFIIE